ncbi:ABC transporter permease [Frankia sp. Cppng1_Ct_nod]|uniref:ABC transporter permease n=1 Tax=Frankia sp. Cppng1_Ct_nod TaxID=2897162 RepID=UPI0010417342|nr:ABC transporter permease [Frankia sp. Cppng1_Ct_nod]
MSSGGERIGPGTTAGPGGTRSLRRIEPAALAGVITHDLTLFRRYWLSTTFSAVVEPTIYLLAFGWGFGSLVSVVAGYRYVDFLGTGVVATAVLFASAFAGMFQTFIRRTYQKIYGAVLAAPVDVPEIVLGEALWIAARAGVYGCAPLLVAIAFGLDPVPGLLVVPLVGFLTGLGFGLFGIWTSALVPSMDSFGYIISGVMTPLFLVAGTFFPVDGLPHWARTLAQVNPLYHCVQLVRDAAFGFAPLADLGHIGALAAFAGLMWLLAVRHMRRRLID